MKRFLRSALVAAAAVAITSPVASAQRAPTPASTHWAVVSAGGFANDIDGDGWSPVVLGRIGTSLGRGIGRFFLGELTAGYAATSTKFVDLSTFETSSPATPTTHADLNIGVQLPWIVTPYATIGGGLFRQGGSASQTGTTQSAAGGLRVRLGHRLLVSGELRYEGERFPTFTAQDAEFTGGIGWRF